MKKVVTVFIILFVSIGLTSCGTSDIYLLNPYFESTFHYAGTTSDGRVFINTAIGGISYISSEYELVNMELDEYSLIQIVDDNLFVIENSTGRSLLIDLDGNIVNNYQGVNNEVTRLVEQHTEILNPWYDNYGFVYQPLVSKLEDNRMLFKYILKDNNEDSNIYYIFIYDEVADEVLWTKEINDYTDTYYYYGEDSDYYYFKDTEPDTIFSGFSKVSKLTWEETFLNVYNRSVEGTPFDLVSSTKEGFYTLDFEIIPATTSYAKILEYDNNFELINEHITDIEIVDYSANAAIKNSHNMNNNLAIIHDMGYGTNTTIRILNDDFSIKENYTFDSYCTSIDVIDDSRVLCGNLTKSSSGNDYYVTISVYDINDENLYDIGKHTIYERNRYVK